MQNTNKHSITVSYDMGVDIKNKSSLRAERNFMRHWFPDNIQKFSGKNYSIESRKSVAHVMLREVHLFIT